MISRNQFTYSFNKLSVIPCEFFATTALTVLLCYCISMLKRNINERHLKRENNKNETTENFQGESKFIEQNLTIEFMSRASGKKEKRELKNERSKVVRA